MSIPLYLAMNEEEMSRSSELPKNLAITGLCFSPEGQGLDGMPKREVPEGVLFLLEDRIPWEGQDLETVCREAASLLMRTKAFGLLLDFERSPTEETQRLAYALGQCCKELGCKIGMPKDYAVGGALFLPSPPCSKMPEEQEGPVWFEAVPTAFDITVTPQGAQCRDSSVEPMREGDHFCPALGAYYRANREHASLKVHLYDTPQTLLNRMEAMGAELAVGMWRQWQGISEQ